MTMRRFDPDKETLKLFWYWINERHAIYTRRTAGKPSPWTKDKILHEFKFTNVFRELDRVTLELHARIDPLHETSMSMPEILYRILLFRAFNWPETYDALDSAAAVSSQSKMLKVLRKMEERGRKIFTGAYIVTNAGRSEPKIEVMSEALAVTFRGRQRIWEAIAKANTMQDATKILCEYPMMGDFTSYEVVCDLRYQKGMLDKATDVMTWANLGPGAKRGSNRIINGGKHRPHALAKTAEYVDFMHELLLLAPRNVRGFEKLGRPFEMREIEHSLCEFDKYMRVKRREGRPRSRYEHGTVETDQEPRGAVRGKRQRKS